MRFLIDTNVLISSEPTRQDQVEATTAESLELARIASGDHQLLVHPSVVDEIARDRDPERRRLREVVVDRYPSLEHPPRVQARLEDLLGVPAEGSHDWFDHQLLACVYGDAVHGLITQDGGIHTKARRLDVADRVHTVADAVAMLRQLAHSAPPNFVPSVDYRPLHTLQLADSFFDSLRQDYPGFDAWFRGVARSGRQGFVIDGPKGEIAGICVLKDSDDELLIGGRVAKVSTLKVTDEYKGSRYGELLLKALFLRAAGEHDALWLTVYDKHSELIELIESFGFEHHDKRNGEHRFVKRLVPPASGVLRDALAHHIAYGPPALRVIAGQTFVVPIQPHYHASLFPDAPGEQATLFAPRPHGNALRKAYLCRANIRTALPGATLLFYRSRDAQAVSAVGVLERSLVSSDPDDVSAFVGSRTVYTTDEVAAMCAQGSVLALLFRQDRFLEPPITIDDLVRARAVRRAPQTTIAIRPEGIPWLTTRLDA